MDELSPKVRDREVELDLGDEEVRHRVITRSSRLDLLQKQHGGKAGFTYQDLLQGTRVVVDMPLNTD